MLKKIAILTVLLSMLTSPATAYELEFFEPVKSFVSDLWDSILDGLASIQNERAPINGEVVPIGLNIHGEVVPIGKVQSGESEPEVEDENQT